MVRGCRLKVNRVLGGDVRKAIVKSLSPSRRRARNSSLKTAKVVIIIIKVGLGIFGAFLDCHFPLKSRRSDEEAANRRLEEFDD